MADASRRARTGKAKRGKRMDRTSALRLGAIVVLALVLLGVWAYQMYDGGRLTAYLSETDAIQREHSASIGKLNDVVAAFSGEPTSAAATADAFGEQAAEFARIGDQLDAITPPAAAPRYHRALGDLYNGYSSWCTELGGVAHYIDRRSRILETLSKAVERFDEEVTAAASNEDVVSASGRLRASCEKALEELRALKRPRLLMYSDEMLRTNIADLGGATDGLGSAVQRRDRAGVTTAAAKVKEVLARDWALAVQESDLVGTERYAASQRKLTSLEEVAVAARGNIGGAR